MTDENKNNSYAATVANQIALDILTTYDGRACHRIQILSGRYPDAETGEGGLNQSALETVIAKHLEVLDLLKAYMTAEPSSPIVKQAWDNLEAWWKDNADKH